MIYTITLNPALDYVMDFSNEGHIKKWAKTQTVSLIAGGKGINASIMLKNFNVYSEALILSGGNTGAILEQELVRLKIRYLNFNTNSNTRINVKAQYDDTYELLADSRNENPNIAKELLDYLMNKLKQDDFVLIMGSKMKNLPENILEQISEIVATKKAQVVYDISGREVLKLLKYKPLLIKPNYDEIKEMFDLKNNPNFEEVRGYAQKLLSLGAQNVIVSDAEKGATLFQEEKIFTTKPIKITLVNGSGAGDSMVAGFVWKFLETNNPQESLDFANACGAATAASPGIADMSKINKLFLKN